MNVIKWIVGFIAAGILAFVILNKNISDKQEQNKTVDSEITIKKRYDENDNLKSDVEMVNGVRNGIAHNYYNNGLVHSTIYYKDGVKNGTSTWFYENGKPYRETPYALGKKHGTVKKYYKTGTLMAEIPFSSNKLQPGTNEYSELGTIIDNYPTFKHETINKTKLLGAVYISFSGKKINKIVEYSAFYIKDGKQIAIDSQQLDNTIQFKLKSVKGKHNHYNVVVWLTIKTKMRNKKILVYEVPVNVGRV